MSDFKQQQERLLSELIRGQIDQATYERRLLDLQQRIRSPGPPDTAAGRTDTRPTPLAARPSGGATPASGGGVHSGAILAGQFRVRDQLGRGGMGEVWRAYDTVGDRDVVIKILPRELQGNAEEMDRVQQTFRRVHDLQHQHICPTHLLGQDASVGYFLVMKYIPGVTLRQYWRTVASRTGSFPYSSVNAILAPVASALDYAHQKRVVHRDIKSENIMVTADGRDPQIVDFGLAAEIKSSQARVTKARMEKGGTYPYMAPEQWRGQLQDGRTDQYALGVVAYELLAGRLPFADRDPVVLRQAALTSPVPVIPGLPPTVLHVLSRALAKDPAHRYESCTSFVKSLAASLAGAPPINTGRPPPLGASSDSLPPLLSGEVSSASTGLSGTAPPPIDGAAGPSDTAEQPLPPGVRKPSLWLRTRLRLRRWRTAAAARVNRLLPDRRAIPPWAWMVLGVVVVLLLFTLGLILSGVNPFSGGGLDFGD